MTPAHLRWGLLCGILFEKIITLKLSGYQVYYTSSLVLLVENMLCSELHYQKGFDLIPFPYKIWELGLEVEGLEFGEPCCRRRDRE
jgi:hypothetical protein